MRAKRSWVHITFIILRHAIFLAFTSFLLLLYIVKFPLGGSIFLPDQPTNHFHLILSSLFFKLCRGTEICYAMKSQKVSVSHTQVLLFTCTHKKFGEVNDMLPFSTKFGVFNVMSDHSFLLVCSLERCRCHACACQARATR